MFQLDEGGLTYRYELNQFSLAEPFPFAECRNLLANMLPWGKVTSNNVQVQYLKNAPEGSQVSLPIFEQSQCRDSNLSFLGKIALGQISVFPLSLQVNSQRRVMERKFEHFSVRERENSKKVLASSFFLRSSG